MKKFLVGFGILFVFAVILPIAATAQSCRYRNYDNDRYEYSNADYRYNNRRSNSRRYRERVYYRTDGYTYRRPSFYRRHRNLINIGIGTGGGALIGGLLGGGRGAAWGALAGAGSGALYTYKIRPQRRYYYR